MYQTHSRLSRNRTSPEMLPLRGDLLENGVFLYTHWQTVLIIPLLHYREATKGGFICFNLSFGYAAPCHSCYCRMDEKWPLRVKHRDTMQTLCDPNGHWAGTKNLVIPALRAPGSDRPPALSGAPAKTCCAKSALTGTW
jgi:hypothetical protein